jgi:hypothetical protein
MEACSQKNMKESDFYKKFGGFYGNKEVTFTEVKYIEISF